MNLKYKKRLLLAVPLLAALSAGAQTNPVYIDGPVYIGAGANVQLYGNTRLGSNAQLAIQGGETVTFYDTSFKMDAGARVYTGNSDFSVLQQGRGTGVVSFTQPNPMNKITIQQLLDGGNGGNPANAGQNSLPSIVINDSLGVKLVNTDSRVGTDVSFTKGHLYTDKRDLVLATAATFSGYDATKFVVTNLGNDTGGHVVKENYTAAFGFPVGMADGDYTPVVITPAVANTIHVNVTDYTTSRSAEPASGGVERTWNIFGNNAGGAAVALQHNTATNQTGFSTNANYVTQYGTAPNNTGDQNSATAWQLNTAATSAAGTTVGSEVRNRSYLALPTSGFANEAFFTVQSVVTAGSPDFTPSVSIDATNFTTGQSRDFAVAIYEINNQPSSGQVTFRIPKGQSFSYTVNTTATSVNVNGGTIVNNSDWNITQTSGYIQCVLKPGVTISAGGVSTLGFTVTRNAGVALNSSQNITAIIVPGSGGDSDNTDNSNSTTLTAPTAP